MQSGIISTWKQFGTMLQVATITLSGIYCTTDSNPQYTTVQKTPPLINTIWHEITS